MFKFLLFQILHIVDCLVSCRRICGVSVQASCFKLSKNVKCPEDVCDIEIELNTVQTADTIQMHIILIYVYK